jgi:PAT family beta-lactamase induction signal transducer AmpG
MAEQLGWAPFYVVCALLAIPGLLLLPVVRHWFGEEPAAAPSGRSALADAG